MTAERKFRLEVALLAILFGAGAGWGAFQWQLADLYKRIERIDKRVSAMYCGGLPVEKQPGCQ